MDIKTENSKITQTDSSNYQQLLPRSCSEIIFSESVCKVLVPSSWCELQRYLKLDYLIIVKDCENRI